MLLSNFCVIIIASRLGPDPGTRQKKTRKEDCLMALSTITARVDEKDKINKVLRKNSSTSCHIDRRSFFSVFFYLLCAFLLLFSTAGKGIKVTTGSRMPSIGRSDWTRIL